MRTCCRCGASIPPEKRSDSVFCSVTCRKSAEKQRFREAHPEYAERQRLLTTRWRHLKEHGHTEFITRKDLNLKDMYRVARHLGYRSMLEVGVARQLQGSGVGFTYEPFRIEYEKPHGALERYEHYETTQDNPR